MGHGFKSGAGSGGLNFRLVGGVTQPADPVENTIWVNTGEKITGYILSPVQPETAEEGTVWIKSGPTGEAVNILKKNQIILYLNSCSQMIRGEWVKLNAWLYRESGWIQFARDWDGYYFRDGEQYVDVTGGWITLTTSGTVKIGETLSVLSAGAGAPARLGTAEPVDLTDVTTLYYDSPSGRGNYNYGAYLRVTQDSTGATYAKEVNINTPGIGSIDVSDLTGEYYIAMHTLGGGSGAGYGDIRAIWKE